jgi:Zn-dependent peptidase ImmA (M78 family)/DNA-binding XRE family transcriptional regulator
MFNPNRLSLARERRGYTKAELARRARVDTRSITAYEAGEREPSQDTLRTLAHTLAFPIEFFFGEDLERLDMGGVSFRSMSKMTAGQRDMALAQGALALSFSNWIEHRFELPEPAIPDLGYEEPEAAAESLRTLWGLGQLRIRNIVHLLESKGIRVFSLGVEAREVDAFSFRKGSLPFVFLNSFKSAERSRFDAAHELGHLVLHGHASPNGRQAEFEADRFAAAFLMPRASLLAEAPKSPTMNALLALKSSWAVSVVALARRLHEIGGMRDWHYRSVCIQIAKRGYRISEPNECPRERSAALPQILRNLYEEDGLSLAGIARNLSIPASELEQMLFGLVMTTVAGGRRRSPPSGPNTALFRIK